MIPNAPRLLTAAQQFAHLRHNPTCAGEGLLHAGGRRDLYARAMQATDAGNFFLRILNVASVEGLLNLECRVHAFGRQDVACSVGEHEGGVVTVVHDDIDLIAEFTATIDDVGAARLVSPREVFLKELEP